MIRHHARNARQGLLGIVKTLRLQRLLFPGQEYVGEVLQPAGRDLAVRVLFQHRQVGLVGIVALGRQVLLGGQLPVGVSQQGVQGRPPLFGKRRPAILAPQFGFFRALHRLLGLDQRGVGRVDAAGPVDDVAGGSELLLVDVIAGLFQGGGHQLVETAPGGAVARVQRRDLHEILERVIELRFEQASVVHCGHRLVEQDLHPFRLHLLQLPLLLGEGQGRLQSFQAAAVNEMEAVVADQGVCAIELAVGDRPLDVRGVHGFDVSETLPGSGIAAVEAQDLAERHCGLVQVLLVERAVGLRQFRGDGAQVFRGRCAVLLLQVVVAPGPQGADHCQSRQYLDHATVAGVCRPAACAGVEAAGQPLA